MNALYSDDRNPAMEPDRGYNFAPQECNFDQGEHRLHLIAEVAAERRAARKRLAAHQRAGR